MMDEKIRDFIHKYIGYLIVALVSAVYICTAFITIQATGKSPGKIIADGAIAFLLGFFITSMLDVQGIMNGERDERYIATLNLHRETVEKISPCIDRLDEWCSEKNKENLKTQRIRILATEGLKYSDFFTDEGNAKEYKFKLNKSDKKSNKQLYKQERRRRACYLKALRVKLKAISAGELTSEGCKVENPYYFGRTKEQYERQGGIKNLVSKLGTALIFGYYGAQIIQGANYANVVWYGLQVASFVLVGSISMYNSYMFITGEYRGGIVKKIHSLEMFDNYTKTHPQENVKESEGKENGNCKE